MMFIDNIFLWYVAVSIFTVGVICGSFLNCLIWRSYANESAARGRSYCPNCRHPLAAKDLIPIFSFLALRGKCRYCRAPISWQYPLVEIATGIIFLATAWMFVPEIFSGVFTLLAILKLLAYWALLASLVVVFTADIRWYFIPDGAIISGLAAALLLHFLRLGENHAVLGIIDWEIITNPLLAAVLAAAFFLAIFLFSRGTWMGFGDVKYAFLMGLALGFPEAVLGLFLAFFFGAIIGLGLVARQKKSMSSQIPFGPFLVFGTATALFFSGPLIGWYFSLAF